jgi:thiamine-phosphate pyrophosphorylase
VSRAIPAPPLLLITDRRSAARDVIEIVRCAVAAGCRWVMVREKDLPAGALADLARRIVDVSREIGTTVLVNSDVAAARAADAAGVHLPAGADVAAARQALGADALIGASTHSLAEARAAEATGADYVTLSPVFLTASKPGYGPALGLDGLRDAAAHLTVPVIALAGIDATNAGACIDAGAAGVAVMGGVMRAADPAATVRALIAAAMLRTM